MTFKLRTVSPVLLHGSDPNNRPELRAASVRGQLRYWLRALVGATTTDLQSVWSAESAVFGSTGCGSTVSIRLNPMEVSGKNVERFAMLPHRSKKHERGETDAVAPNTMCRLVCVTRPGVPFPEHFKYALSTWLLLGGVGKRSRRMFGGFALEAYSSTHDDIHDWWFEPIENPGNLKNNIKNVLQGAIGEASSITHVPEFPILHPTHSRIVVGEQAFGDAEEANRALFHDLLRSNKYRQHEDYFGGAVGGRRASPLIAQVRQIDNSWYPVLTYMRSRPERAGGRRADWHVVDSFMNDAEKLFDGETVWGGRFA